MMSTFLDFITTNNTDISSTNEANIEKLQKQITLNTCLEALFTEINFTADILYLSYNSLRTSKYSIKLSDHQMRLYELTNKLSGNINVLSESFSHILSITGKSYNRFEDINQDLNFIDKNWGVLSVDDLTSAIVSDLEALNTEEDNRVKEVFELVKYTLNNLSVELINLDTTVKKLILGYKNFKSADTNLKDKLNEEANALAYKFYIYTSCIDALLKKYIIISNTSSQKVANNISKHHLSISEANEQLNQMTAHIKHKWSDKFQ